MTSPASIAATAPAPARSEAPPVSLDVVARLVTGLNREQRRAVTHGDGPLLVLAGPGTGKTEVLTRRVAWLIATGRALPRDILALTFTDNAAEEMQARVDALVPYGQADAAIHTFHAFGDRLLREHAFELGLPGDVRLVNRSEAIVLLREHLFELGLSRFLPLGNPTRFLGALADLFARAKDEDVSAAALGAHARSLAGSATDPALADVASSRAELASAYARYQELLAARGLIDHGDQIALPLRLLRERPAVREELVRRYRYLLVDEFQDMNRGQFELVSALTGGANNVTVVGDPDQAIYTFRGAAAGNLSRFVDSHRGLRRVMLRRNYRSRAPILEAAQRLIGHSRLAQATAAKAAVTRPVAHRGAGRPLPVRRVVFESPESEADGVALEICRRIERGASPAEMAVLTRTNGEVDGLVRSLRVRGVPARTDVPVDFFAPPSVRPLLAYLRVVADPGATAELYVLAGDAPYRLAGAQLADMLGAARRSRRALWAVMVESAEAGPRGGSPGSLSRLVEHVRAGIELSPMRSSGEVLYDYLRRSGRLASMARQGHEAEARQVARFFDIVRRRGALLAHDRVALLVPHLDELVETGEADADSGPLDVDAVAVLTVHRAKGLEFPVVFLTGLNEGRFPARGRPQALSVPWDEVRGRSAFAPEDALDEERRLAYVAMTRARDELWLTYHARDAAGRRRRPSTFLAEALDEAPPPVAEVDSLVPISPPSAGAEERVPVLRPPSGRLSFSFSQLADYLDCPERYRLRYEVGLPSPPHHALAYGGAMHKAVAEFHLGRGRGEPLSEEALLQAFERAWSPEGFLSREHEEARFAAGRAALRRFRAEELALPDTVVAVEHPFAFDFEGVRIVGRMDRVDETVDGTVVYDYKSSDVSDQRKADTKTRDSLQLHVYALAREAKTGVLPVELALYFMDTGVVGRSKADPARLDRARRRISKAISGVAGRRFEPAPDAVACGYCPFRQICPSSAA